MHQKLKTKKNYRMNCLAGGSEFRTKGFVIVPPEATIYPTVAITIKYMKKIKIDGVLTLKPRKPSPGALDQRPQSTLQWRLR